MRTLTQVQPRTPVDAVNTPGDSADSFVISQPGSYYLTANIVAVASKNGISIVAGGVTLDLNGFSLLGSSTASTGVIILSEATPVVIQNGLIGGWGGNGVSSGANNLTLERLTVVSNTGQGVLMSSSSVAKDCRIFSNGSGIIGGADCVVSGCVVNSNIYFGISLGQNFDISKCTADFNLDGFFLANDGQIRDCVANDNEESGIDVNGSAGQIRGCVADNNGYAGLEIDGSEGQIRDCLVISNYQGIVLFGNDVQVQNCVADYNSASGISLHAANGQISDCVANYNGPEADGISVGQSSRVSRCVANYNAQCGIQLYGVASTVENCIASGNTNGILSAGDSVVIGNHVSDNSYAGIQSTSAGSRIELNHARNNGVYGIYSSGGAGFDTTIRNTSSGNGTNYSPSTGATFGPVQTPATATSPWANF
jgi:parallel beta-helix repeat protein